MKLLIQFTLVLTGIVHLLPLSGAISALQLKRLYGVEADEISVALLLRHRAVLFGLIGAFFIYAAFEPAWQPVAFIAGFVAVGSFVCLGWFARGVNPQIARVVKIDAALIVVLGAGAIALIGNVLA
ncbi:phosphopantetheine adenylyltransferase [Paraburkholderia phymatum]|uniref:Phosphopantetheine adenylyltransferase n=1 Tax=Paraburkholderia phymatum (strain DSM 17167 / CIP 108236 / LMG 21445 / STM815) TaxID=391038 RepID=B2JWL9_PARP8|nr:hypothetical protein [Paraburkholderia phymatum]ACC75346.1 conserved hypothetical protein [Paraburkholderia phymatum STM815]